MKNADCGLLLKQISDHMEKMANHALREDDLTLSQFRCLEYLYQRFGEKVPLKEIEAHFHIAQPTVAGIISRLAQKGLIVSEVSEHNLRAKTVSLTEKGGALAAKSGQRRAEMEAVLLEPLNDDEQQTFLQLLNKVNNGLKDS